MTVFAFHNIGLYFNDSTSVLSCFCDSYFIVNSILQPWVMVAKLVKYFVSGKNSKFLVQNGAFGKKFYEQILLHSTYILIFVSKVKNL